MTHWNGMANIGKNSSAYTTLKLISMAGTKNEQFYRWAYCLEFNNAWIAIQGYSQCESTKWSEETTLLVLWI